MAKKKFKELENGERFFEDGAIFEKKRVGIAEIVSSANPDLKKGKTRIFNPDGIVDTI